MFIVDMHFGDSEMIDGGKSHRRSMFRRSV
jgi:hypothetical protein